jgi:hypothetical protein
MMIVNDSTYDRGALALGITCGVGIDISKAEIRLPQENGHDCLAGDLSKGAKDSYRE